MTTCLTGLKLKFLINADINGPEAPNNIDNVDDAAPPKKIYFFPSFGNLPKIE